MLYVQGEASDCVLYDWGETADALYSTLPRHEKYTTAVLTLFRIEMLYTPENSPKGCYTPSPFTRASSLFRSYVG